MPPIGPHRAKRSLGQNFLVDANLRRKIVEALAVGPDDEVLEIGPGKGALTELLEGRVRRLVVVELDDGLANALSVQYAGRADVHVVHGDILQVAPAGLVDDVESLKVIGNIPYNITTPILFGLLARPRPSEIVLMVQEEVADRIVASEGTAAYGALAVGVQSVASAERLFRVGRRAFRPVPGVDSAVIRVRPLRPEPLTRAEEDRLRVLVRAAFQWRRKQLGKILRDHPDLAMTRMQAEEAAREVGFDLRDRPERLSPEGFIRLTRALP